MLRKDLVLDGQQGGNWLVSSGLDAGDQVIVSGVQKVKPGTPAKPSPWQPANAKPAAAPAQPTK